MHRSLFVPPPETGAGVLPAPLSLVPRPEAPTLETPRSFAEPALELAALRGAAGLLDATDAGLVLVEGADAAAFLQRLLANEVRGLAPDEGNQTLLLSPQGRVLVAGTLLRRGPQRFELRLSAGRAEEARALLEGYHFADAVTLTDATHESAPLALVGPHRASLLAALGGPENLPAPGRACTLDLRALDRAVLAWSAPFAGLPALWLDAGPRRAPRLWRALQDAGAVPVGLEAREVARVEAGRALLGAEVDRTVYPQEVGLDDAFALDKGCYVGQEVVAKLDTYGGLKRRLAAWRLADEAPVPRGTPVATDEMEDAGSVGSWIRSPAVQSGLALGLVKLRALRGTPRFRIGGVHAELVELPLVPPPS